MTGHDDMVARIAVAILDTDGEHPMERGRAVLRAMREPSAAMVVAWLRMPLDRLDDKDEDEPRDTWQTMIDAALDAEPPVSGIPKAVTHR